MPRSSICILILLLASIGLTSCDSRPDAELLLIAPFTPGLAPAADDPDTLRRGLRDEASALRMVPRNVTDEEELRAAVQESNPDVVWIRAAAGFNRLLPSLPKDWTGLLILSRPPARSGALGLGHSPHDGPTLIAPAARSEQRLIELARSLLHALREGSSLEEALGEGSAWRLIGDGDWKLVDR